MRYFLVNNTHVIHEIITEILEALIRNEQPLSLGVIVDPLTPRRIYIRPLWPKFPFYFKMGS